MALSLTSTAQAFTPSTPLTGATLRRSAAAAVRPLATPVAPTALWNSANDDDDAMGNDSATNRKTSKKSTDPTPALVSMLQQSDALGNVPRSALVAALALALSMAPLPSMAAMTGGRIGGSSFSSPSVGRSYSAPSSRSYSRSYYYSRPSVAITPMPFGSPFVSPFTPFYSPYSYAAPGIVSFRGPNFFSLLVLGGMAFALSNAVRGLGSSGPSASFFEDTSTTSVLGPGTSVMKLSVALDVSNRNAPDSMLRVLERLATSARTDSRVGIQNLSSQVALELLRRKSSIVSASSTYQHYKNRDKAQREFNSMSIQERGKFERETISKYGGVDYYNDDGGRLPSSSSGGVGGKATMAVVTLVLAIDGDSTKIPKIRSLRDVEDALRKIASDAKVSDCLQGAEILWTPEGTESLSMRDVIADYPELTTV
jgi:uncharacterized membrane protein